jgi:hypothetical protein
MARRREKRRWCVIEMGELGCSAGNKDDFMIGRDDGPL